MSSLPKVIVVGASGYIGQATLSSLVQRHGKEVEVFAGVRDPSKLTLEGVTAVQADLGDKAALAETLKGYDRVFLVTPGHIDRTQLTINGIEAAQEAGVKFTLVLSVLDSGADTIFGRQFGPIEEKVKSIGLPGYAIVRLAVFIDNNYGHVGSIKGQNTFYDPRIPDKLHTPVAVADAGKASADILANPSPHLGKTYKLVMPPYCLNDFAAALSEATGRTITVTTVPYEAAKEAIIGLGLPEWQANGVLDLNKLIDNDSPLTNEKDLGDFELITGEKPTTLQDWCKANAAAFK